MGRYLVRRVLVAFVVIWFVMTLMFFFLRLLPGDVALALSGERPAGLTPEQRETVIRNLGLDRPLHIQYFEWLYKAVVKGDLGVSFSSKRPVLGDIAARVPRTVELAIAGLITGLIIGIPTGVICALNRNGWLDILLNSGLVLLGSLPVYVSGIALLLIFGLQLGWVPTGGYIQFSEDPIGHIKLLILPSMTLGVWMGAVAARMTRASLLEVLSQDYVRTAFSKGLSGRVVYMRHALKNALIPVITAVGLQVGSLLGGAVLTETIFTWPGLGLAYVNAVIRRDFPMIQGVVIVAVTAFVFTNMLVDVSISFLDPRIVYE
jgi:peptide/nickel transport system permease protein